MKTSQINVEVEPALRERVKVRAAQEAKSMREVVESALRLYLASPVLKKGTGSVGSVTGASAAAAEPVGIPEYENFATCPQDQGYAGQPRQLPTVEDLKRLVQRTGGAASTARELVEGVADERTDGDRRIARDEDGTLRGRVENGSRASHAQVDEELESSRPAHGRRTVETGAGSRNHDSGVLIDPREVERRRRAAQDRLRTHPEDANQDPSDDDGAGF